MRKCPKCGAILDAGEKCDCGCSITENADMKKEFRSYPIIARRTDRLTPWERDWIIAGKRK